MQKSYPDSERSDFTFAFTPGIFYAFLVSTMRLNLPRPQQNPRMRSFLNEINTQHMQSTVSRPTANANRTFPTPVTSH